MSQIAFDQRIVDQRVALVFVIDDLLQLDPNRVPGDFLAIITLGPTHKELA